MISNIQDFLGGTGEREGGVYDSFTLSFLHSSSMFVFLNMVKEKSFFTCNFVKFVSAVSAGIWDVHEVYDLWNYVQLKLLDSAHGYGNRGLLG